MTINYERNDLIHAKRFAEDGRCVEMVPIGSGSEVDVFRYGSVVIKKYHSTAERYILNAKRKLLRSPKVLEAGINFIPTLDVLPVIDSSGVRELYAFEPFVCGPTLISYKSNIKELAAKLPLLNKLGVSGIKKLYKDYKSILKTELIPDVDSSNFIIADSCIIISDASPIKEMKIIDYNQRAFGNITRLLLKEPHSRINYYLKTNPAACLKNDLPTLYNTYVNNIYAALVELGVSKKGLETVKNLRISAAAIKNARSKI